MSDDKKTAQDNLAADLAAARAAEQFAADHDDLDMDELDDLEFSDDNSQSADQEPESEEEQLSPQDQILDLEAKLADAEERVLRAMAETQNMRRRADREKESAIKFGAERFARDIITVADNLRMAISAVSEEDAEGDPKLKNMRVGVVMTEKELLGAFEKNHVQQVVPQLGDDFDHNLHQAMTQIETADIEPGKVALVMTAGYRLHDRLLKPAMVGVAKAPA